MSKEHLSEFEKCIIQLCSCSKFIVCKLCPLYTCSYQFLNIKLSCVIATKCFYQWL